MADNTLDKKLQNIFAALSGDSGTTPPPYVSDKLGWWLDTILTQLIVGGGGSGGGGTALHNILLNRELADQHPISSITGLQAALNAIITNHDQLNNRNIADQHTIVAITGLEQVLAELAAKQETDPVFTQTLPSLATKASVASELSELKTETLQAINNQISDEAVSRENQITEATTAEANARQAEIEKLNNELGAFEQQITGELQTTNANLNQANQAIWGRVESSPSAGDGLQGILNGPNGAGKITELGNRIDGEIEQITDLIPTQANDANQLADKAFVNSTVSNMAARFVTPDAAGLEQWASLQALRDGPWFNGGAPYSPTDTDYAIFINTDNTVWRAAFNSNLWSPTYKVNDSPFTADQLAAINSTITAGLVDKLTGLPTALELTALLAGKLDVAHGTASDAHQALFDAKANNTQASITTGSGTDVTTGAQTNPTVWGMVQNIWNRLFALNNAKLGTNATAVDSTMLGGNAAGNFHRFRANLATGDDLNTFTANGVWTAQTNAVTASLLNAPTGIPNNPSTLIVFGNTGATWVRAQMLILAPATAASAPRMWYRHCYSTDTWSAWREVQSPVPAGTSGNILTQSGTSGVFSSIANGTVPIGRGRENPTDLNANIKSGMYEYPTYASYNAILNKPPTAPASNQVANLIVFSSFRDDTTYNTAASFTQTFIVGGYGTATPRIFHRNIQADNPVAGWNWNAPWVELERRLPTNDRNNPSTWQTGVEIDFGDGTFGRRYTGTVDIAVNTNVDTQLTGSGGGNNLSFISSGGYFTTGGTGFKVPIGTTQYNASSGLIEYVGTLYTTGSTVRLRIATNTQAITSNYDVWYRYVKI